MAVATVPARIAFRLLNIAISVRTPPRSGVHGAPGCCPRGRAFRHRHPGRKSLPFTGTQGQAADMAGKDRPGEMVAMMFWYGDGWAWWQAGLMWLAVIAFGALLIWAFYALITGITREAGPGRA
jgi:hypothetical protein